MSHTPAAVKAGSYEMTQVLISHGAWVEQVCWRKWTATHEAAKLGNADILLLLLRNGGRVNHRDVTGATPLAVAAEYGHAHVAEVLLSCGESPEGGAVQTLAPPQVSRVLCAQVAESILRPVTVTASYWTPPAPGTPPASSCCWTTEPTPTCPATLVTCQCTRRRTPDTTSKWWMGKPLGFGPDLLCCFDADLL